MSWIASRDNTKTAHVPHPLQPDYPYCNLSDSSVWVPLDSRGSRAVCGSCLRKQRANAGRK